MYEIVLKTGKEKQLLKHHPWVFSGAIDSVSPIFKDGDLARVTASDGRFVAYGWYDEKSHIILHLMSWDENVLPDDDFLIHAVKASVLRRRNLFLGKDTEAFRLIHGEADFIPGVACDIYAGHIRIIISSRYAAAKLDVIVKTLTNSLKPKSVTVFTDREYARAESLPQKTIYYDGDGNVRKDNPGNITFAESGIFYEIENTVSQKSGFYCDQRDNRNIVESYAAGRNVLDACSYTGAFTLHALRGGAESVLALDASESALRHLLYQIHINEDRNVLPIGSREKVSIKSCDVFEEMRTLEKDKFDLMILDPPKLAATKGKLDNALRAYKDLNRVAMMKIRNGGIIASFSCSGSVTRETFRQMIAYAAADAGVEVQLLRTLSAGEDHPIRISFPESEYLKGFVYRVIK